MTKIRLMADTNISPQTVSVLQQQGWDIIRVPEVLPANASDRHPDDKTIFLLRNS